MRLNSIDVNDMPPILLQGINPFTLNRLGAVVALVGRNGSGKSRTLKIVDQYIKELHPKNVLNDSISFSNTYLELLNNIKKNDYTPFALDQLTLNDLQNKLDTKSFLSTNQKLQYEELFKKAKRFPPQWQSNISNVIHEMQSIAAKAKTYVKTIDYKDVQSLQLLIDKNNDSTIPFENLIGMKPDNKQIDEMSIIKRSALSYLAKLPNQLFTDYHGADCKESEFHKTQSYERFILLKKYINVFLRKELTWQKGKLSKEATASAGSISSTGSFLLNNTKFDYNKLSSGEKTLLAYALLFFLIDTSQRVNLSECIIIIDEPELHLHPESEIAIVNGIRTLVKDKGQLWIATHSINILSQLSHEEIFMVKDNQISHPSSGLPGQTLRELMGMDEQLEKLTYFLSDMSTWEYLNFMTQCFEDPEVIDSSNPKDPQVEVFKKSIRQGSTKELLLDFGAGSGRLFKEFSKDTTIANKIKYSILEPDESHRQKLSNLGLVNLFDNHNKLPDNTFDYIVLCNVLHEIPILEWDPTLNKIASSLSMNGHIIIIEDRMLPKGEKIGETGFLILDPDSIQELFCLTSKPVQIYPKDDRYKGRIQCTLIQKEDIKKINNASILKSIEKLKQNTFERIEKIRNDAKPDSNRQKLGRESAFLSQQYINTILAVKALEKNIESEKK